MTLKSFPGHFENKFVKLFNYNKSVAHISEVGSMKQDLHNLAMETFYFCIENSVFLKIEWIPRTLNTTANQYSKIFDFDDWSVSNRIFHYFDKIWRPLSIDRFATVTILKSQGIIQTSLIL